MLLRTTLFSLALLAHAPAPGAGGSGLGLPSLGDRPPSSEDTALISLGRQLFFDKTLSADGTISCSSCHVPERAFADGRSLAQGIRRQQTTRNSPSLLNVRFNTSQFWDGRRGSLEEQALDPIFNPREHGLRDSDDLLQRIRESPRYVAGFKAAFRVDSKSIDERHVARALASFEKTLIAGDSPFDRYYYGAQSSSLSASAERGLRLFTGAAGCDACHTIGRAASLFTDQKFHSINIGTPKIAPRLADLTSRLVESRNRGGRLDSEVLSDEDLSELGRFVVTLQPADIGKFKTPSLRNVALTAPYMHDGSIATLEEAVDRELYGRGADAGRALILTPAEKSDLITFLQALTSRRAVESFPAD